MISIKEALRTIKYKQPMSMNDLVHNRSIIERRMKERRHNFKQRMRDKVTLTKIEKELIIK